MREFIFSIFAVALILDVHADTETTSEDSSEQVEQGYNGFYFGLGFSATDGGIKSETTDSVYNGILSRANLGIDANEHITRLGGALTVGFGSTIQKRTYMGLETGLNLAKNSDFFNSKFVAANNKNFEIDSKLNSLIPSLGFKLGYIDYGTRGMVYLKAGAAYARSKVNYREYESVSDTATMYGGKCSRWTPIIALGGEKLYGKNVRARLEVEYQFPANKAIDFDIKEANYKGTVKLRAKDAVTLRAMAVYSLKR